MPDQNKTKSDLLAPFGSVGIACGKAILIGEHSAVAGHPAIALPLTDHTLTVRIREPLLPAGVPFPNEAGGENGISNWDDCWLVQIDGMSVELTLQERQRLTQTLSLAVSAVSSGSLTLSALKPQFVFIESYLPLGAGLGSSAALSAALIRAVANALQIQLFGSQIAGLANELDSLFHGRASGLDAATVVADSMIRFQKGQGGRPIANRKGFWLLLTDTPQRTPTHEMVRKVAELKARNPELVEQCFQKLADLTDECEARLRSGQLVELGGALNQAHGCLQQIGVSTEALDIAVEHLRAAGALGAKLTGGGGGGLALGLFANRPALLPDDPIFRTRHFLTFVPESKSS